MESPLEPTETCIIFRSHSRVLSPNFCRKSLIYTTVISSYDIVSLYFCPWCIFVGGRGFPTRDSALRSFLNRLDRSFCSNVSYACRVSRERNAPSTAVCFHIPRILVRPSWQSCVGFESPISGVGKNFRLTVRTKALGSFLCLRGLIGLSHYWFVSNLFFSRVGDAIRFLSH